MQSVNNYKNEFRAGGLDYGEKAAAKDRRDFAFSCTPYIVYRMRQRYVAGRLFPRGVFVISNRAPITQTRFLFGNTQKSAPQCESQKSARSACRNGPFGQGNCLCRRHGGRAVFYAPVQKSEGISPLAVPKFILSHTARQQITYGIRRRLPRRPASAGVAGRLEPDVQAVRAPFAHREGPGAAQAAASSLKKGASATGRADARRARRIRTERRP